MTSDRSSRGGDRRIFVTVLIVVALVAVAAMIVLAAVRIGRVETLTRAGVPEPTQEIIAARAALVDLPVSHPPHVVRMNDHGVDNR